MEVVLEPYKKITIRSYLKHDSPEAFVDAITLFLSREAGGRGGSLLWADGIIFRHFPYAPSESVTKEYLNGHLPIDHVEFAPMPAFKKEIQTGGFVIAVLDVTNHLTLGTLAKWIATNLLKRKSKTK